MIYFTSDLHFYHVNIIRFCAETRPFASVDDMNSAIVKRWNRKVGPADDVWHLGDFAFTKNIDLICDLMNQLNGKKHFIYGNHDVFIAKHIKDISARTGVVPEHYKEISLRSKKICLFHYPIDQWNNKGHGSIQLHGHCHGTHLAQSNQLDVGWDSKDFDGLHLELPGIWSENDIFDAIALRSPTG